MAEKSDERSIIAEYELNANGMKVSVSIYSTKQEFVPKYEINFSGVTSATRLLLLSFRRELMSMVPFDPMHVQDSEYVKILNNKYMQASGILIDKYLPNTDQKTKDVLNAYILNMMLGLGELEAPLADDNLEEITINGAKDKIWVFHKVIGWCKTNIQPASDDAIYDQAEQIGRRVGREINNLTPLMDAELVDGSRVNATLFPISQSGNTITIRKFAKNPWTMPAMIKNGTISPEVASLIWLCIQNEISLLISGGTASGKTSFLNASSIFFPSTRRVISVEETRELTLPEFLQWVPMVSREANPEGKGAVSLYNLMINALRQRPDIMLVGEIRTSQDAETMFEAIHTGHAVYGTVHADNVQDTIIRMTNPPINTPKISINSLGAIVTAFRHRSRGIRRILEFGEILRTGDANVLYRWNMHDDTFAQISEMTRLTETLELYAGLNEKSISADIQEKASILRWMAKNEVFDVNDAGFVVANYYTNKKAVNDAINEDVKFSRDIF
ncbi:MAG: Flp pilus assembly complex ATPase component TadA [Candidatus Marsarchaeota archaeon]|jgi:flagellar protein FlaI|nr:Flp pilus assembly complex ATPase component TadA [Candidatus Marsarchaeota archaeon]